MNECVIELRGANKQVDYTLLAFRFGQRIRIQLKHNQLPEPEMTTDPQTGEPMTRYYLHINKHQEKKVRLVCSKFAEQSRLRITCQTFPCNH
ncbi:hypothetical protein IJJ27_01850 [bacterium]|nr:hypothetical protein [bacterium]